MNEVDFDLTDFNKTFSLLHAITRMDARFIDKENQVVLQMVDHRIPAVIQPSDTVYESLAETLRSTMPNRFFYYTNAFSLEYIAVGVWRDSIFQGFVLLGPFLSIYPDTAFISDLIAQHYLPVSERKQLQEFYSSLTVISSNDSNSLGDLLVNLCAHRHTDSQLITADFIQPDLNKEQQTSDIADNKTTIEHRYLYEKKFMDAIARGDRVEIARMIGEMNSYANLPDRIPESPIRSTKNIMITLNTLCRIAAERGGIHPVYLHHISEKFSIMIERSTNLPKLKKLNSVMIEEYCEAVHTFSTRSYSTIVKNAVNHIDLNLEKSLTLQEIAAVIHVNASHLSRKFKQEVGMNMMDFINHKRVEESKLYLQRGNIAITEIAFMVGFNDLNYFARVFKKFTAMTPTQYIKASR
ncbi:AraC family transcriptional regulator [Paenibacillus pectinilyticus]|uniref:AraC family transcriptional regulator n=1 Tax=Paenibacillus pectinilyticus TaxID=512399 RepID=A0A1C1A7E6_9BACL|nr:AraC family transcriptional regulator [Paenibacillus pectinilyticus]OCT16480.1 AraC family transcriptional regulator [Paenibacillus pectinilyticus]